MKKLLVAIGVLMLAAMATTATTAKAADTMTYRLEQVSAVSAGKQYVFVQNNRAMIMDINGGELNTTATYATEGLSGTENFVWTLEKIQYVTDYFAMKGTYSDGSPFYLAYNNSKLDYATETTKSHWKFTFTEGIAKIETLVVSPNRFLGLTKVSGTADGTTYKTYTETNYSHAITVYELVPEAYTRTIEQAKVGNIGTICLPYQVSNPTGAEFYQMAYKETDGTGNPTAIYYEAVEGALEAGYPYVFVSTATAMSLVADESVERVSAPKSRNGFYGTFKEIADATTEKDNNKLAGNYIIYNNQFQLCGLGCGLSPYRAYIKVSEVPLKDASSPAPTRRMLAIGEDVAPQIIDPNQGLLTNLAAPTNCSVAHKVMHNGQIVIERDGQLFTLMGAQY